MKQLSDGPWLDVVLVVNFETCKPVIELVALNSKSLLLYNFQDKLVVEIDLMNKLQEHSHYV